MIRPSFSGQILLKPYLFTKNNLTNIEAACPGNPPWQEYPGAATGDLQPGHINTGLIHRMQKFLTASICLFGKPTKKESGNFPWILVSSIINLFKMSLI